MSTDDNQIIIWGQRQRPYKPRPHKSKCYQIDWDTLSPEQTSLYQQALAVARSPRQRRWVLEMLSPDGCETPILKLPNTTNTYKERLQLNSLISRLNTIPNILVHMQEAHFPIYNSFRINVPYTHPHPSPPPKTIHRSAPKRTPTKIDAILRTLKDRPWRFAPAFIDSFIETGMVTTKFSDHFRAHKRLEVYPTGELDNKGKEVFTTITRRIVTEEQTAFRYVVQRMNARKIHVKRTVETPYVHYEIMYGDFPPDYKGPRYTPPVMNPNEVFQGLTFLPRDKPKATDGSVRKFARKQKILTWGNKRLDDEMITSLKEGDKEISVEDDWASSFADKRKKTEYIP
jgi:hypothetical protein